MLMKYTQVSREGVVSEPPLAQLTYGALLSGRTSMVGDSSNSAKKVRQLSGVTSPIDFVTGFDGCYTVCGGPQAVQQWEKSG